MAAYPLTLKPLTLPHTDMRLPDWGEPEPPIDDFIVLPVHLVEIDGGYRVKTTDTHHVDVLRMLYNWRVVTTPIGFPYVYDRGWCYEGAGVSGFLRAVLAVLVWDGSDDTEPEGWLKRAGA